MMTSDGPMMLNDVSLKEGERERHRVGEDKEFFRKSYINIDGLVTLLLAFDRRGVGGGEGSGPFVLKHRTVALHK